MAEAEKIQVSNVDLQELTDLLARIPTHLERVAESLEDELLRAEIVPDDKMPSDVVRMNSQVVFEDMDTGKVQTMRLTYPSEASIEEGRVSVLAPVGVALLGLKVGQDITWPLPGGRTRHLRVKDVINDASPTPVSSAS